LVEVHGAASHHGVRILAAMPATVIRLDLLEPRSCSTLKGYRSHCAIRLTLHGQDIMTKAMEHRAWSPKGVCRKQSRAPTDAQPDLILA
jgi:hypothetical protein